MYGQNDPALTYKITSGTLETGDSLSGSLSRLSGENVGTYAISSSLANANYDITYVAADFTIFDINTPIANPDAFNVILSTTTKTNTTKVTQKWLISNDKYSGLPNETRGVTFVGVVSNKTALGGNVSASYGWVYYTPPTGALAGAIDSFTYTVKNGENRTSTGTVTVSLVDPNYIANVQIDRHDSINNLSYFSVMPGMTFQVERSLTLSPANWAKVVGPNTNGSWLSEPNGRITIPDTNNAAFYRFKWQP